MGGESDTRHFVISTDNLQRATSEPQDRGGASMYQQAWRLLTTELGKRREFKAAHGAP
jgi:hypothetical protein